MANLGTPLSALSAALANRKKPEKKVEELNVVDATKSIFNDSREIPIAGVLPGIALEKVTSTFGEPVNREGNNLTFNNGLKIEIDGEKNIVKKIILQTAEIVTPEGVAVNMSEMILNTTYKTADDVEVLSDGADYKYFNKDKTRKFTFKSRNGYLTEIDSELL